MKNRASFLSRASFLADTVTTKGQFLCNTSQELKTWNKSKELLIALITIIGSSPIIFYFIKTTKA